MEGGGSCWGKAQIQNTTRKHHLKIRIISVFNCKDGQTLAQAAQRGCGDPKQSALGDPALEKGLGEVTSRGRFQPH